MSQFSKNVCIFFFGATLLMPLSKAEAGCDKNNLNVLLKQAKENAKKGNLINTLYELNRIRTFSEFCLAQNRQVDLFKKAIDDFPKTSTETKAMLCSKAQVDKDLAMYNCYGFGIKKSVCQWYYKNPNWKSAAHYMRQAITRCSFCLPGSDGENVCKQKISGLKEDFPKISNYLPDKFNNTKYIEDNIRRLKDAQKRKKFDNARRAADDAMKLIEQCLAEVRPDVNDYRMCEQKKEEINKLLAQSNKEFGKFLSSRGCPPATLHDSSIQSAIQTAFNSQFRQDLSKNWKLKSIRLEGTRWERMEGIDWQLVDIYACLVVKKRKLEPKCQFRHLTFKRKRIGSGWSKPDFYAATTEGSGGIGDFNCKNIK